MVPKGYVQCQLCELVSELGLVPRGEWRGSGSKSEVFLREYLGFVFKLIAMVAKCFLGGLLSAEGSPGALS